jgi:hypothetical protein
MTEEQEEAAELARAYRDQLPGNVDNRVTDDIYSKLYFVRYQYMAIILDALAYRETISFKQLKEVVYSRLPKSILRGVPVNMILPILQKMHAVGYITINEPKKNYLEFTITDLGMSVVKDMTVHNIAATTFFSHQALKLSKYGLIAAIASVVIAVISIGIAIALAP